MQALVLASQVDQAFQDTTSSVLLQLCAVRHSTQWCCIPVPWWLCLLCMCMGTAVPKLSSFSFSLLRISHVRDFITKYQGSEGSVPFTLTTSLPFRELQDETLTLEEAKLQNAVVVQRLRKTTEPFRLLVIKAPDNDYKSAATPNGQLKNEQKNAISSTRSN